MASPLNMIPVPGRATMAAGAPLASGYALYAESHPEQRIWSILRSEQAVAAATSLQTNFFADQPNTLAVGNYDRPNTIPDPQIFVIYGVTFKLKGLTAATGVADCLDLIDKGYVTLEINNRKDINRVGLDDFPAGGGLFGETTAAATNVISNGQPSPAHIYWYPVPFVIKGSESFNLYIEWRAATANTNTVRVVAGLHGILIRRGFNQ